MEKRYMHTQPITDVKFIKQIQRLQKNIQIYEELADKVRNASVMDRSIYSDEHDSDWLSINREDYAQIMEVLSKLDLWKPWNQTIQPRITK